MTKEHLTTVCKLGQKQARCRYLVFGKEGFQCVKVDPKAKGFIDSMAKGDNCPGFGEERKP